MWARALIGLLAAALCGLASAATYSYRSDTFAWESASNAITTWDRTCTIYPGDDDKATINLTGGFVFRFAGTDYSSVRVLANGMLQFGADTGFHRNFANTTLPAGAANPIAIAGCVAGPTARVMMAYWTDLNPSQPGGGNVTWQQKGSAPNRRLVVSWNGVFQYNTSTPYSVQIILYEGGQFKYQYGNANATGARATIGVQVDASDYTLYSFNSGYNANGSAIRWFIPSGTPVRLAEYRFDEYAYTGKVGEVLDNSGNLNHGVALGGAANSSTAWICRGLDVPADASGAVVSGVDTQVNVLASVGNAGSVSFFYRAAQAWNSGTAAMLMDATGASNEPFYLQRDGSGALRLRITDSLGASLTATSPAQTFAAATWVHVAATWRVRTGTNQTVLRLYINGSLVATTNGTTAGSLAGSLGSLLVGDARSNTAPTGGTVNTAAGGFDELRVYNYDIGPAEVALDRSDTHACPPPINRFELRHPNGQGVTCSPSTLTLVACFDSACSSLYTGGVTGTLRASTGATVSWPSGTGFTIPAGSGSTSVRVQLTTVGSVTLGLTSSTPAATAALQCDFGTPSCSFSASDAGLILSTPNQRSGSTQTLSISAVKKSDSSLSCVPAFTNAARFVNFGCSYANPTTGTLPVRLNSQGLNSTGSFSVACASRNITTNFDATGQATHPLIYADAGQMNLTARYTGSTATGDAGLVMNGATQFVAAPNDFAITGVSAAPLTAGAAFAARVTARNVSGAVTPNFGNEGAAIQLQLLRRSPSGTSASDGVFTGSAPITAGVADYTNLVWSEVGTADLTASLSGGNYLGSGLDVSGSTGAAGAVGPFRPHHFWAQINPPSCGAVIQNFAFAGQAFTATVRARNALGGVTRNYDGSSSTSPNFARALTISDGAAGSTATVSPASASVSSFVSGQANLTLAHLYASKLERPARLVLRLSDSDGVSSSSIPAPDAEATLDTRSGRLQLQSAVGSAGRPLSLPLRLESWTGQTWQLETSPVCASLTPAQAVLSGHVSLKGGAASWTAAVTAVSLSGGLGAVQLAAPVPAGASGSASVALNLGSTTIDRACLATHPATTGANLPWLRSRWGTVHGCLGRWDSDPSATASFGATNTESQRRVHERQAY